MRWLINRKVSVGLALVMLILAFISGSLIRGPGVRLRALVGTGLDAFIDSHNFASPITAVLYASGLLELLVAMAALIILVGAAERLMGWWRTLLAFVVSAVVGNGVGMLLQAAGVMARELWAVRIQETIVIDPFSAISGTLMTASAFAGPLWRRRIRILGFAALGIVFLYSGQPSDLFRLLAALSGLALGTLLARRKPEFRWVRSSHHEARSLLALLLMITAAGPFVSIVSPARFGPLHPLGLLFQDVLPRMTDVAHSCAGHIGQAGCSLSIALARLNGPGAVILAPMPLIVLIVAALGMLRGRRSAALVAIALNALLATLAAFYYGFVPSIGGDESLAHSAASPEAIARLAISVLVPAVIAGVIAVNLRHFTVRVPRPVMQRFFGVVGGTLLVLSLLYIATGLLDPGAFRPSATLSSMLLDLPDRFVPVGFLRLEDIVLIPIAPLSRFVYEWIGPIFWVILLLATLPPFFSDRTDLAAADRDRVRSLLKRGSGSLGHLSTWDGNSYWFSNNGRAGVAYRVNSGVAVTVAEPVGDPDSLHDAVKEFATFCDDNGWIPVFYSVSSGLELLFDSLGWSTMVVAEETVVYPESWSTTGKAWQDVRSSINRAERQGIRAEWTSYPALSIAHVAQIESMSEAWVAEKDLPELGFTLGGFDELRDPDVAVLLAVDTNDVVQAVTSWMPTFHDNEIVGWTLDFMRRRSDSMNGVMEFLIASAALHMQHRGIEFMSLSGAPLAMSTQSEAGSEPDRMQRLLGFLARTLEPVYGFKSLFLFKQKFKPHLRPLLMAYPDPIALPAIAAALARIYLPTMSVRETVRFMRTIL